MLGERKDQDLKVYAVWFVMYPGDSRERWPAEALPDRRVLHYWDDVEAVGRWYADRMDGMMDLLAPDSKGVEPPVLWDAYLVYGPEAQWNDVPTGLRRWGRTILHRKEYLKQVVDALR
jgi:hypothetical protein